MRKEDNKQNLISDKRCPYYKKCKNYNSNWHICTEGEGYYGSKFKADTCLKEK